jgi:hypothetical protein
MEDGTFLQGGICGFLVWCAKHRVGDDRLSRLGGLILFVFCNPLDGPPARREPPCGGELQCDAFPQWKQGLNQPFAERGSADNHRPIVILESTGDDLCGARGAVIHKHNDG